MNSFNYGIIANTGILYYNPSLFKTSPKKLNKTGKLLQKVLVGFYGRLKDFQSNAASTLMFSDMKTS